MTKVNSQKYSKALLEVAQEKGQLEAILSEVSEMIQLFKEDNLVAFLSSEVYSFSAKSELIDTLLQTSSEVMSNFLNTVVQGSFRRFGLKYLMKLKMQQMICLRLLTLRWFQALL